MPTLARIHIHPFKSLDPQPVDEAVLLASGALEYDRRYALVDERGNVINGKRAVAVHRLRSHFDLATNQLSLRVEGSDETLVFDVVAERPSPLADWLSAYFGTRVLIVENDAGGFPDDVESPGPTLISRQTLEAVARWFDLSLDSVRQRFRATLEIDAAEPFWEDHLVAGDRAGAGFQEVPFSIGEANFLGTNPCQRCPVPTRDPTSGEVTRQFAKRFAEQRSVTLPAWAPVERFDHFYRLAVNSRRVGVHACTLRVGDELTLG
jgi:uncharacterized protein